MAESRIPLIMEPAPDFDAKSTHGPIRLSDYTSKGKWVMLFSHPSDFTPVCSTEFIEFARRHEEFEKLNVQLIGLSIDSVPAHIAWVRDLEQIAGVKIKFPLIADLDQKVSQLYGLVHEAVSDTATVRAVFAIDPKGNVRALLYYPQQLGRSVDELLQDLPGLADGGCKRRELPGGLGSGGAGGCACSGDDGGSCEADQRRGPGNRCDELVPCEEGFGDSGEVVDDGFTLRREERRREAVNEHRWRSG